MVQSALQPDVASHRRSSYLLACHGTWIKAGQHDTCLHLGRPEAPATGVAWPPGSRGSPRDTASEGGLLTISRRMLARTLFARPNLETARRIPGILERTFDFHLIENR